jgi:hypothetical protein
LKLDILLTKLLTAYKATDFSLSKLIIIDSIDIPNQDVFDKRHIFCLVMLAIRTTGQPAAPGHPIIPPSQMLMITSEMVGCATSAGSVSFSFYL